MIFFIKTKNISIECFSLKTKTSDVIIQNLPIKSQISTWGDEIYFDTKLKGIMLEKDAKEVFNLGEIAYWTIGSSIAIGFGPTPASVGSEIRLITKCNYWAKAKNPKDLLNLKKVKDGDQIVIDLIGWYMLTGSKFQVKVWKEIKKIPKGKVATYKQIAIKIGNPKASRAVANACGKNPYPPLIPCHRVIKSDFTIGGYSGIGGIKKKTNLLKKEKININQLFNYIY